MTYSGVYTLFGQPASPSGAALATDTGIYTVGTEFTVSQPTALTGIWFYSPSGAASLPTQCGLYEITGADTGSGVLGTANTSPSWSGAAGSGWVKCSYDGSVVLQPGTSYRTCVYGGGTSTEWYSFTTDYWDTGAGASGITSGPLTAPNAAGSDSGNQSAYVANGSGLIYPVDSSSSTNYWIDVEVSTVYVVQTATASASSASFGSDVAVGDTVFLAVEGYSGSNVTMSTSAPTFGGTAVTGAVKLAEVQSVFASGNSQYAALWMLPDLPGGSADVAFTDSGFDGIYVAAYDAAGLGPNPVLVQTNAASATSGTDVTVSTSDLPALGGLVFGALANDWGSPPPDAPWTSSGPGNPASFWGAYQVATTSDVFTYGVTQNASAPWAAAIAAIAPTGTVCVVQTQTGNGGTTILSDAVTEGNTVFLVPIMYGSTDPTSSNVELGGSAVPGTSLLQHVTDTTDCSHDIWMLPDCPGGQTAVTFDVSAGLDSLFVYEVAGLGPAPVADQAASAFTAATAGTGATVAAGPTSPTSGAPEFAIGAAADYNGGINLTSPAGWTAPASIDANRGWSGYQVLDSSGATPSFAVSNFPDKAWTAGIVTVAPTQTGGGGSSVSDTDTGTGADTGTVSAAVPGSDSGAGADAGGITASVPGADTGNGADTAQIGVSGTETGSGADTGQLTAAVPGADTGSGTDTATVAVSGQETGSGSDTATVVLGTASSDTGSASDTGSVAATASSPDSGAGADTGSVQVMVSGTDTGHATDTGSPRTGKQRGAAFLVFFP